MSSKLLFLVFWKLPLADKICPLLSNLCSKPASNCTLLLSPSPFTSLEEFPNFVEVVVELDSLSLLLALVVTEKLAEVKSVKL